MANDIVIPLNLYMDDIEPDNALGSNSGNNALSCYYYQFPTIPQHYLSSIKFVFEAMLHLKRL